MAGVNMPAALDIAIRRFCEKEVLTGEDLGAIRSDIVDISQQEMARQLGRSRTWITRAEKKGTIPDPLAVYVYYGILLVHLARNFK